MSGAFNGRPGRPPAFCAAAPRRPSTSVLSSLPRDFVARRPMGRGAARPSTRFRLWVLARVRTAAAASGAYCCFGVEREDCSWRLLLFLGLLYCQRPRAQLPVCTQSSRSKVFACHNNELAARHTRFCLCSSPRIVDRSRGKPSRGNRSKTTRSHGRRRRDVWDPAPRHRRDLEGKTNVPNNYPPL